VFHDSEYNEGKKICLISYVGFPKPEVNAEKPRASHSCFSVYKLSEAETYRFSNLRWRR